LGLRRPGSRWTARRSYLGPDGIRTDGVKVVLCGQEAARAKPVASACARA
jgi:hypothetical protein